MTMHKKKPRRSKRRLRGLDNHHCRPSSRIKDGCNKNKGNIVVLDALFHSRLHSVFKNMTPDECHEFLDIILVAGGHFTARDLNKIRDGIMARTRAVEAKYAENSTYRHCQKCQHITFTLFHETEDTTTFKCLICGELEVEDGD